jgi:hypothetical protein
MKSGGNVDNGMHERHSLDCVTSTYKYISNRIVKCDLYFKHPTFLYGGSSLPILSV